MSNCTFVDFTGACQALISDTSAGTEVIIETPAVRAGRSLKLRFRSWSFFFLLFALVLQQSSVKWHSNLTGTVASAEVSQQRHHLTWSTSSFLFPWASVPLCVCLSAGQTASWRRASIPPQWPSDPVPPGSDRRGYYFPIAPVAAPPLPQGDARPPRDWQLRKHRQD